MTKKEKKSEIQKAYYRRHRERIKARVKAYAVNNKEASRLYRQRYYIENKDRILVKVKEYAQAHPEETAIRKRQWAQNNQESVKNGRLKKYGLDVQSFGQLMKEQRNCCRLCGDPFVGSSKDTHIDHDHSTGTVRGIVHSHCNLLLGLAKDSPGILRKAAEYLEKYQQSTLH